MKEPDFVLKVLDNCGQLREGDMAYAVSQTDADPDANIIILEFT